MRQLMMWATKGRTKNTLYLTNFTRVILLILFIVSLIVFSRNYTSQETILTEKLDERYPVDLDVQLDETEITVDCDNGKTNLTVDWDYSPEAYTCKGKELTSNPDINSQYSCETIPENYKAEHICMSEPINYSRPIPLYGNSRPVWPTYGEYKYLPAQRWLHSLENGGIVLLYHPCADPVEIKILRRILRRCLRRFIMSPSNLLDETRPLAVLAWGCKVTMSFVMQGTIEKFIRKFTGRGPEAISNHGDFNDQLIEASEIVTDYEDGTLCPPQYIFLYDE